MAKRKSKKKKQFNLAILTLVLAVIVIAVFAYLIVIDQQDDTNAVAMVNGEKISEEELQLEINKIPEQYKMLVSEEEILDQLINRKLLLQEARLAGLEPSSQDIDQNIDELKAQFPSEEMFQEILDQQNITMESLRQQIKEQIMINSLLNESVVSKIDVSDEEIESFYDENPELYLASNGQIRAAHILVPTEEEAKEILTMLEEGDNFTELAKERSQDPSASINGGDLGFFGQGEMVKEFEDAAFDLKVGELSEPVKTQFGFHIIKRLPNKITLEEAEESIRSKVISQKQAEEIKKYLEEIKAKANIQIMGQKENPFVSTGDELCTTEDGIPIIRVYTTSNCQQCFNAAIALQDALANSDVKLMQWELDTGDDTVTEEIEESIPKDEFEILKRYDPNYAVPAYVFGCEYVRIGNAYKQIDLDKERAVFEETLQQLI